MTKVYVISDTHFGHSGVCKFLKEDGTKLRPWDDVKEMDEALVENWNKVVRPEDKVYHLGDVVINRKHLATIGRLNGRKILIKGNHDVFRVEEYMQYFEDIRAYALYNNAILSHVPIHPSQLARFGRNVHGHLHEKHVTHLDGLVDARYINVSVEKINFIPVLLNEILNG